MSLPYQFFGDLAQAQTREFLSPKTNFERIQLILSITWFIVAFFGSLALQSFIFFLIIPLIVINSIDTRTSVKSPFLNVVLRFAMYFFLFIFLRPQSSESIHLFDYFIQDIIFVQKNILSFMILAGVVFKYVRLELLKPTAKSNLLHNYIDFLFQCIKGIGITLFIYIFFELIEWVPPTTSFEAVFPNTQDLLIIIAIICTIIASQSPEGKDFRKLMAQELLLLGTTRFERMRDALFKISVILLILLRLVPLLTINHINLISQRIWDDTAILLFVIAIITLMMSFFEPKDNKSKINNLANKLNTLAPERFNSIKDSLENINVNADEQQFFKLNENVSLVNKQNSKVIAKKNSLVLPIKETPEGMAAIFVGENEFENIKGGKIDKRNIDESATAIIIPNDLWQSQIYNKLEAIKLSDENIKALALKGLETKEKIVNLAQSALVDYKKFASPQMIEQKIQGMVENFQQGKYFISETKKGTHIRLPGITVIEDGRATFVRVFGIKVFDSKGYTIVKMPFINVLETPDYELVKLPGIKVLESGKNSLVNIAGFEILDGDRKQLEEAMKQIQLDTTKFDSAFDLVEGQINNILESPDNFLLTKNSSGEKIELLTGNNSDTALVSGSKNFFNYKKEFKIETGKHRRHKVKPTNTIKSTENETIEDNFEPEISNIDKDKLEKLYRIMSISKDSIDFERLIRHLNFTSQHELEDWLINLNLKNLLINWEENKIYVSEDSIKHLKRYLRKN